MEVWRKWEEGPLFIENWSCRICAKWRNLRERESKKMFGTKNGGERLPPLAAATQAAACCPRWAVAHYLRQHVPHSPGARCRPSLQVPGNRGGAGLRAGAPRLHIVCGACLSAHDVTRADGSYLRVTRRTRKPVLRSVCDGTCALCARPAPVARSVV